MKAELVAALSYTKEWQESDGSGQTHKLLCSGSRSGRTVCGYKTILVAADRPRHLT